MEDVKVCRVCLDMDVKLHDLRSLESYYESVIGPNMNIKLSPYVCYVCAALVRKFYFFRLQCLRSLAVLRGVADGNGKVKPSDIRAIDGQDLHITPNFRTTIMPQINIHAKNYVRIQQAEKQIKLEPDTEQSEENKSNLKDHNYASLNSMDQKVSSGDEPLSLHKEKNSTQDSMQCAMQLKSLLHSHSQNSTKEKYEKLEFTVGTDDGDSEHTLEIPQVINTDDGNLEHTLEVPQVINTDDGNSEHTLEVPQVINTDDGNSEHTLEVPQIISTDDREEEHTLEVLQVNSTDDRKEEHTLEVPQVNSTDNVKEEHTLEVTQVNSTDDVKEEYTHEVPQVNSTDDVKEENTLGITQVISTDDGNSEHTLEVPLVISSDEENSEHTLEVPQVVKITKKRRKKQIRTKAFEHGQELANSSLTRKAKRDVEEFFTVTTLTFEEQMEQLQKRKESPIYKLSPHQCNLCFKGFATADAFDDHVSKHAATAGSRECKICKIRLKTEQGYLKHVRTHEEMFLCKLCEFTSTNRRQIWRHQNCHEDDTYKRKNLLNEPLRIPDPSEGKDLRVYECEFCGSTFPTPAGRDIHTRMMHPQPYVPEPGEPEEILSSKCMKNRRTPHPKDEIVRPHECQVCGSMFGTSTGRNTHVRMMHPQAPVLKPEEPKEHLSSKCMKNRRTPHPKDEIVRPHECEHCGSKFRTSSGRNTHVRMMHPQPPVPEPGGPEEPLSGKYMKNTLTLHPPDDEIVRQYECELCGGKFPTSSVRNIHISTMHPQSYVPEPGEPEEHVPPKVTGTTNGHSTSRSVDRRKKLTQIPDINLIYSNHTYKIQKVLVEATMVPCINAKPYQYAELLMTLSDLVSYLFPEVSVTRCRALFEALGITLYRPNTTQLQVLRNSGKCKSAAAGENGLALVQIRDVMQHMLQFKYMLRSGHAADDGPPEPKRARAK